MTTDHQPFFAAVVGGRRDDDGELYATIGWPIDRPLLVPSEIIVIGEAELSTLNAAALLVEHADAVIHTDATGNRTRRVRDADFEALSDALAKARSLMHSQKPLNQT